MTAIATIQCPPLADPPARLHLGLAPLRAAPMLNRQRLARLDVLDDLVDLGGIQRAFDAQDDGQHHDDVAIRHQQVARGDVAMRDESLDGLLALAEQQGHLTRLPRIIESRPAVAVSCLVLLIPLAVCPVCGREQPNAGTARRSEMGQKQSSANQVSLPASNGKLKRYVTKRLMC